jgi:arylformamidase
MMALHWYDVSIPLRPEMTVWPGDPPFELAPLDRIAQGNGCNTSRLTFSTHTGTHVDAPWHFEDGGRRLHEVDTSLFFGAALLIEALEADTMRAADLGPNPLPPRVLIKTRNAEIPVNGPFREDYVALAPDAAERLVEENVRLVGVDYLSVAPFKQPGQETHHRLLRHEVLIVEGLCLHGFSKGIYSFTVLPLPVAGADGAPCRAFIGREE